LVARIALAERLNSFYLQNTEVTISTFTHSSPSPSSVFTSASLDRTSCRRFLVSLPCSVEPECHGSLHQGYLTIHISAYFSMSDRPHLFRKGLNIGELHPCSSSPSWYEVTDWRFLTVLTSRTDVRFIPGRLCYSLVSRNFSTSIQEIWYSELRRKGLRNSPVV
jgi:hypothetical protein